MTRPGLKKVSWGKDKSGRRPSRKPLSRRSSPLRQKRPVNCSIQETCRSCPNVNLSYEAFAKKKYDKALAGISEALSLESVKCLPLELSPEKKGYRTSVKLAVRRSPHSGKVEIGLFAPGSHKLVMVEECYVQHPAINQLVSSLQGLLQESQLSVYDEEKHTGVLRYVLVRVSKSTKDLSLTYVVTNRSCYAELRELTKRLKPEHQLTSAFINVNSEKTNRVTGLLTKKLFGSDTLKESLCYLDLRVSPLSFLQVNPSTAEKIYGRVEQLVGKTSRAGAVAWDLYCGIGIFSMVLMRQGYQVFGVEENPYALGDAEENAKRNLPDGSYRFKAEPVENFIESQVAQSGPYSRPEVVVVNPARTGLDALVVQNLIDLKKKNPNLQLIYVSCEAQTLTRDLKALTEGPFALRQLECFDMFPHTEKLEWLSVLT